VWKQINISDTASAPTVGTAQRLFGTYALMMVDPDIPPSSPGGATSELLHWMQTNLVSSNTSTSIAGVKAFALVNPSNTAAFASYIQPSPPNKSPTSHRYTQLLFNTTGNNASLAQLKKFAVNRANFSATNVAKSAGLTVLAGNSFNVTANNQTTGVGLGSSTGGVAASTSTATRTSTVAASGTGKSNSTATSGLPKSTNDAGQLVGSGAFVAGLGALGAAVLMF
jgi:phosphatidylethanolamine-binding protein (PEBP) family uncharacterized protein